MTSIFLYEDFKLFLADELDRRATRNPKYSLRAFARDLGISFSRLSEVISKNEGINRSTAVKIADRLKMSELEKEYFEQLVLARHGRTVDLRTRAENKIKTFKAKRHFTLLRENFNGLLTKWYYVPLMEFLTLKETADFTEVGKALDISKDEVAAAVSHLTDLGYIESKGNGRWKKSSPFLKIESATPARSIRDYHASLLDKAHLALQTQPIAKRKYLSTVFGVRKEFVEEARKELENFNRNFIDRFAAEDEADSVYCFAVQLYPIETPGK